MIPKENYLAAGVYSSMISMSYNVLAQQSSSIPIKGICVTPVVEFETTVS